MTDTTTEILQYGFGSVHLNTFAKNVESISGRLSMPGKRTANVAVAGKEGQLYVPDKRWDQNVIALNMWVKGCLDDGTIPGGGTARKQFFANLDQLARLFSQPGLQPLVWTLPDGSQRIADVEVLDTIDFSVIGYNPMGKFAVSLTMPNAFWRDYNSVTDTFTNPPISTLRAFVNLAGGSAPMDDLVITVTGPWNGFGLLDAVSGASLGFGTNLAGGDSLVIDCGAYTCKLNGVSTLTPLVHSAASFYRAQPDPNGAVALYFGGSGLTGASSVSFAGRRKHLVG